MKKLLPIGTVVILKNGTKKLMITGYKSKTSDNEKVYDYNGCIFPEGFIQNVYCLFNHKEIDEVFYLGLDNDETKQFMSYVISDEVQIRPNVLKGEPANEFIEGTRKGLRKRTAPTKPLSISEMRSKYGVTKVSGGNIFNYKIGK